MILISLWEVKRHGQKEDYKDWAEMLFAPFYAEALHPTSDLSVVQFDKQLEWLRLI